ncbi:MAG: hypothetical protein ACLS63_01810 [Flavonifractor plautii]
MDGFVALWMSWAASSSTYRGTSFDDPTQDLHIHYQPTSST